MSNIRSKLSKKFAASSVKGVFSDLKQYISFFAALLIIQTIFWTLLITAGINQKNSETFLEKEFKYHFVLNDVSEIAYAGLQNAETVAKIDSRLSWPQIEYLGYSSDDFGTRSYKIGVILNQDSPNRSLNDFWGIVKKHGLDISQSSAEYTPFYTDNPSVKAENKDVFKNLTVAFSIAALIFFLLLNKLKAPRRDDGSGAKEYRSTSKENMYTVAKRVFFTLMALSAAAALIFLMLLLSAGNGIAYFFLYIALFVVCALFLTELFNVKINHYKFRYGIYMTFGAGFKKLYSSAAKELLIVSAITLLPSLGISSLICKAVYHPYSDTIRFFLPGSAVAGVVILSLLIILTSTYIPIKRMALKPPARLLHAEDNSNLTSSPRRSRNIAKKSFPAAYEALGMWRFRKYFLRLVAIAVSFSTVFLCGIYIAHINRQNTQKGSHEFEISSFGVSSISDDELYGAALSLSLNKSFDYFFWKDSVYATSLKIHALLSDDNIARNKYVYDIEGDSEKRDAWIDKGYTKTTDSFELVAYNKTLLDTVCSESIYNIEGDIYSILENDNTVIISEYVSNLLHFDFKVGDSVIIAIPDEFAVDYDMELMGIGKKEQALTEMIAQSGFEYRELKIGAIIDYGGADGSFIIGMNRDAYTELIASADKTFTPSFMKNILVYTQKDASSNELNALSELLKNEFSSYDYRVTETYNTARSKLGEMGGHHALILTVSFLIMLISPLIWFFSQLKFYTKRGKEIFILKAFGATKRQIRRLYLFSGAALAALSAVMTLAMSYIADYIIYLFCTWLVPSMNSLSGVTVSFYMPPDALIICIVSSVVCGFLSSYLPFAIGRFIRTKADRFSVDGA